MKTTYIPSKNCSKSYNYHIKTTMTQSIDDNYCYNEILLENNE